MKKGKWILIVFISIVIMFFVGVTVLHRDAVFKGNKTQTVIYYNEKIFNRYAIVIEDDKLDDIPLTGIYTTREWDYRENYDNKTAVKIPCIYSTDKMDDRLEEELGYFCLDSDQVEAKLTDGEIDRSRQNYIKTLIDGYYGTLYMYEPTLEMVYYDDADTSKLSSEIINSSYEIHKVKVYRKSLFGTFEITKEFNIGFSTWHFQQSVIYKDEYDELYSK